MILHLFVTGSESFVGRSLLRLCDRRQITVSGIDARPPSRADCRQLDLLAGELTQALPEGVDAIVHLAARSSAPDCHRRARECFETNVMGTLRLIEAAAARNAKQFIFASSEWVYTDFSAHHVVDETTPINIAQHTSEYALSKLVSEANLRQQYQHGFCATTVLRFGIIYGPRPANWSAVEAIFHAVAGAPEVTIGSLATGRCFIHVDDIAAGILSAVGLPGFNVVNLEGDRLITLAEIIEASVEITGRRPPVIESDAAAPSIRRVSNVHAKQLLDWAPTVDLASGLETLMSQGSAR